MPQHPHIRKRNLWISAEFERLQKGKHPRYRGKKMMVREAIEIIRRNLRRKKKLQCSRNLTARSIWNIIYRD